jgi:hypothetical protein
MVPSKTSQSTRDPQTRYLLLLLGKMLLFVFLIVLALHVLVVGGFTIYHLMGLYGYR